ncbi:MAG: T9SS type A sorting domain-containing protein [Bacteroidetes bacterium]|nr:T9SS type A sorting domain-containing protein [Bacteroidota bacterium]
MKKLLVLLVALATTMSAQAPYHKMLGNTNDWFVSATIIGVKSPDGSLWQAPCISNYIANRDSSYGGKLYKVFKLDQLSLYAICFGNQNDSSLVREDTVTRKIYIISKDSTHEILAYDFSMNVGDSIFMPFYPPGMYALYNMPRGYYKLDSIVAKHERIGYRNHYYLSNQIAPIDYNTGRKYYLEWIESIGAVHFPLNLFASNYSNLSFDIAGQGCMHHQDRTFITCKYSDNQRYYFDSCAYDYYVVQHTNGLQYIDSCRYFVLLGGVNEYTHTLALSCRPNPATDHISITYNNTDFGDEPLNIIVTNSLGQIIRSTPAVYIKNGYALSLSGIPPGIYFLSVTTAHQNRSYQYRFVKE